MILYDFDYYFLIETATKYSHHNGGGSERDLRTIAFYSEVECNYTSVVKEGERNKTVICIFWITVNDHKDIHSLSQQITKLRFSTQSFIPKSKKYPLKQTNQSKIIWVVAIVLGVRNPPLLYVHGIELTDGLCCTRVRAWGVNIKEQLHITLR
jgi:hypothetical protein